MRLYLRFLSLCSIMYNAMAINPPGAYRKINRAEANIKGSEYYGKGRTDFFTPSVGEPPTPPAASSMQGRPCLAPGCAYRRAAAIGILPRARSALHPHGGLKPGAEAGGCACRRAAIIGCHRAEGAYLPHFTILFSFFFFWCA
jgi:hypothetical protein